LDITAASVAVSDSTTLTITLTVADNRNLDLFIIGSTIGLQVRPTSGTPLASGQIFRPPTGAGGGGTAVINGITSTSSPNGSGGSNFGSLAEVAGAASKLAFTTQPGAATTGAIFGNQPVVKTQDQFGNLSATGLGSSVPVVVALSAGPGVLLGTTTLDIGTAAGNGTVSYSNLQIDVAGSNDQLTASASGLTSGLSSVFAVNGRPTISVIPNLTTNEDRVATTAFVIGDAETPPASLILTATSTNTTLVPVANIAFGGTGTNRTLSITPVATLFGTTLITISVSDGTASASTSFLLTVNAVNDSPTMNTLTNWTILEDAAVQTVKLSGIGSGPGNENSQSLTITATSSAPSLIPNPTVNYASPSATGTLNFTPVAGQNGVATITVIVKDDGGTANGGIDSLTNTFTVTVQAVNDPPTLDPLNDIVVNVNPGQQTVNLTGISSGPSNESGQTITISATSGNLTVIPNPTITYTSPNATGTLRFTPVNNASGSATITVTASDNGGTSNGGQDTITRQFTITVSPLADVAISQSAIPNPGYLGGTINFQSTVTNRGPTTASGIQVTNILPAGIGAVSVTSSQGTSTNYGSVVVSSLGSLPNGGFATVSVTVEPLSLGTYTNFASVSSGVPDPNAANNSASLVATVTSPNFLLSAGSLTVESCSNGAVDPAERVTMSLALQNTGTSNTANLVATLKVSGGVTAPGAPQTYGVLVAGGAAVSRSFAFTPVGNCGGPFTVTLQLLDGPVSLGAVSKTFVFGQLVSRITPFANTNDISIPSSGAAAPYPSTLNVSGLNTNILKLTVTLNQLSHTQPDDLDILLVGPNGQKTLLMSDCGGINIINNVNLTFDSAAATGLPDSGQIISGTFKPTDFQVGDVLPSPAPAGPYVTDLTVFNGTDPNGAWQLYVLDDFGSFSGDIAGGWTLNITTLEPSCCVDSASVDVALTMTAPDPIVVGDNTTFTIVATNLGPATATGVTITNPIPPNSTLISASASQGTVNTNGPTVVYSIGSLANGGSATATLTFRPTLPGPFTNSATIYSTQADRALGNNTTNAVATVDVPQVTIDDVTVVEGNTGTSTNAIFTIQLSSISSQTITVGYVTTDLTAVAGVDYRLTNGIVTFSPGQTTKTIMVNVLGDNLSESTEFFGVNLTNLVNVTAGNAQGVGTIVDDDPLPSLSISDASMLEGNSGTNNMQFTVTISPVSGQSVSFNYSTANASALAGTDYAASSGTIFMNPGQASATVFVPVIGDTISETNETFLVNLSGVVNATFSRSQAVGTILNDDFLATIGAAGTSLAAESCGPANGVIDPNESVTVNFSLRNISAGTANTTNLTATLLQLGGVTAPGPAQNYGALTPGGPTVSRPFTFVANGVCGDTLVVVLQLQDGGNSLGTITNFLPTGKTGLATNVFSNLSSIPIPESGPATPYPSTLSVAGLGDITKVTVTLFSLSHTYPSDMEFLLVSPGGQAVRLMSDAGDGMPISNVSLTFDDAAASFLPGGTQIFSGTYKPSDYPPDDLLPPPAPGGTYATNLSILNGTDPNGIWNLYIADGSVGDSGSLAGGWRLTLTTLAPSICCGADSFADMSIGLGSSAPSILLQSNITYTINVTNLGPNIASDVFVTNVLSPNVTFVSANSTLGTSTNINGTIVCNLGTMTNAARGTITIIGTGVVAGYATNIVTVISRAADSNPANSSASVTTAIVPPGPLASFSGSPTSGIKPLAVTFNDSSLGAITNRAWIFGNGATTNTTATNFIYTYANAGTNSVTLTVSGPGGTDALTLPGYIVVTNPPPQLAVTPGSLNFGAVITGQSSNQTFQVANLGGLPLTGTATVSFPFSIQSGSPLNLNPGQTGAVVVSFAPATVGAFSNVVVFSSNGGNSTNPVTGSGFVPPNLSVSPPSFDFGTVAVGTNAQLTFLATNSGSVPITNALVSVNAGAFSIVSSSAFRISGFSSTNIAIRFTPGSTGSFSNAVVFLSEAGNSVNPVTGVGAVIPAADFVASPTIGLKPLTVTFTDNSTGTITNRFWNFGDGSTTNSAVTSLTHLYANAGTNTVTLTVTGPVGTNSFVRPNYVAVTNLPPQLALNPTNLNFGQLIVGQTSTQSFQVMNLGGLTLTGSVSTLTPFGVASGNPFSIAPGTTGVVAVSYIPVGAGSFSNVAVFISNGGNSTNSLTGTAITPGQLSVLPSSINFGTVATGSSLQSSFTLTNLGGAPLTNGTAIVGGGPFVIVSGTPFSLPGFGSTNVVVSFTPAAASSFSNVVICTANNTSRTNSVIGTGAIVPVASFVGNPTSGARPLSVSFTDSSTGTITNRFWDFGDGSTTNTTASTFNHVYANAGTNSVSLTVTGPVGTNTLPRLSYIVVTNPPPLLVVSPAAINFGAVTISQSSTQNFQIVNGGGLPLVGTVSATLPFAVENGSYNLAAGQTGFVAVSFSPLSAASFSNAVVFNSNGGNSTNTVTGVGLTPAQLGILPNTLSFGAVVVGANVQASFLLTNQGGSTLSNGTASVNSGPFTIISGSPFTLAGFASTNLVVRFTPPSTGNFTNFITFTIPGDGNITNAVTGTGALVPVAAFTGIPTTGSWPLTVVFSDNSTGTITNRAWNFGDGSSTNTTLSQVTHVYAGASTNNVSLSVTGPVGSNFLSRASYIVVTNLPPQLVLSPTNMNFGSLIVGQSVTQTFQVMNGGQLSLAGNVSVAAPFSIQSGSPYNVAPGQTGLVAVSFSPGTVGTFSNAVIFLSNGGNSTNGVVGSGFTPGQMAVLPSVIDFGPVAVGSDAQANFIVTNSGSTTLTNGTVSIGAGPFSLISPSSFGVVGFAATNITVRFTPLTAGAFTNFVTFLSEGGNSSNQVSGTGAVVPVANFGGDPTIGLKPLTVTFTDSSTGAITNRFWDFGDGSTSNSVGATLSHTYTNAGTNDVILMVSGPVGSNSLTRVGYVIVTNQPAQLVVNPTNFDFGAIIVGQTNVRTVQVINPGGTALSGSVSVGPPFDILNGTPFTLAAGQTGIVAVSVSPTNEGSFSSALVFLSNGGNSTNGVTGSGAFVPAANFTAAPTNGFWPLTVILNDNSSGTITNRTWNFGDGSTTNTPLAQITHRYNGAGTNNVSLGVSGPVGSNFISRASYIVVTNLPSQLVLSPTNMNFGPIMVGQSVTQSFQIINGGQLSLTGSVSVSGPFAIQSGSPFNIPGGQLGLVKVSFTPGTLGNVSNAVIFLSNGGNSTNGLIGSGFTPAQLTVLPPAIHLGTVVVGSSVQGSFTLTNSGSRALTNGTISIGAGPFSVLSPTSFAITAFGSSNIAVQFAPTSAGSFTNSVSFLSDGGNRTNQISGIGAGVPVASFVGSPNIGLKPLTVTFTDSSTGTITNRLWDFGDGATSNSVATTVSHIYATAGTNDVVLTVTGPVGSNSSTRVKYVVVTNLPPQLVVSPTNIDFGAVVVGQTNVKVVQVINPGGTTLTGSLSVEAPFDIQSGTPFTIAAGQTGVVEVSFSPSNAGVFNSALVFVSNGGNSTNGVVGTSGFVPAADFTATPTNGFWPLTVVFSDTSAGTITNRSWTFGDGSSTNTSAPEVTHVYGGPGTRNVSLGVTGPVGSNFFSRVRYIVVTNLPPELVVIPTMLDYAGIIVGETNSKNFQLLNAGQLSLDGSFSVEPPFFIEGDTNYNVAPGQTGLVTVTFTPASVGVFSNAVLFSSNGGRSTNSVTGIGVTPPQMGVSPALLDFGVVDVDRGQTVQLSLVVTNRGTEGITNVQGSIAGGPFTVITQPFDVPGLSSSDLLIQFAPTNSGSFSNFVVVVSNGGTNISALVGIGAAEPNASFIGSPVSGLKPLSVTFTDTSTGAITNRFWDFGDGTTTNTLDTNFTHIYTNSGTNTVTLTLTGPVGTNTISQVNYVQVTNLPPQLTVGPSNLSFATLVVGVTNTQTFQITNTGGLTLTGTATATQPFSIQGGSPFTLAPGQTGAVFVSFGPVAAGSFSNVVIFSSNGGNSTNTVIGGALPPPQLIVTPQTVGFGTVAIGSNLQSSFVATNTGGGLITNVAVNINTGPFSVQSVPAFALPAFSSTNVTIRFTPASVGNFTNLVTFLASNGPNRTNTVTGVAAQIPVAAFSGTPTSGVRPLAVSFTDTSTGTITNRSWNFGDGVTTNTTATSVSHVYANASTNTISLTVRGPVGTNLLSRTAYVVVTDPPPLLAVNPTNLNFGTLIVDQTSTQTVRVANLGGVSLSGTVAASLPFSIQSGNPYTISPGETGQVTVVFSPSSAGNFNNSLVFQSNGGNSTNSVTGSALTPGLLGVAPVSLDFGIVDVDAGTNALGILVLTNLGGAPITNGTASINIGSFSVVSGSPFSLPGFGSTNLVLAFRPASAGSFSDVVLLSSSGGLSTNSLTGTGALEPEASFIASPTVGLNPLFVTFTDLSAGTITNRTWFFGDGSLTNTSSSSVSHLYAGSGTYSVSLNASGPVGNSSVLVFDYILVTNSPPNLILTPISLDFGKVVIGQTNTLAFQVINSGGLPLSGTATAQQPFMIEEGAVFDVAPGQTGLVRVAFSPAGAGGFSNKVTFASNGGASDNSVFGIGLTPPQLIVSPSSLNFGVVVVGSHIEKNLVLTNAGDAPLTNGTVSVGDGPSGFSILSSNAFAIPGHGSTNIVISFSPDAAVNFSNIVVVSSDGGGGTFPVTGLGALIPIADFAANPTIGVRPLTVTFTDSSTGTIATRFWDFGDGSTTNTTGTTLTHVYVNGSTNTISLTVTGPVGTNVLVMPNLIAATNPPPQLVLNPANLNFGSVIIGQSRTQNVQVINSGGLDLAGNVTANPPFAVLSGTPYNVAPGQTGLVSVSFSPVTSGSFSNVLTFSSNGGNSLNPVEGIGLTPPQLAVSPGNINFGTVAVGANLQRTFVLTNMGGAALSNGVASISAGTFSLISGTPFSLPGFGSTNLVVRFAPSSASSFSNVVVITSGNAGSSTNVVAGIGAVVPAASFVGSPVRGVKPLTVTFTDNSSGTITNRFWNFGDGVTTNTTVTSFTHVYTNASTNSVSLRVTGPVGTNTQNRNNYIAVTNLPPKLLVNPTSFAFPSTITGQTNITTFQITNSGGTTLTGSVSAPFPFGIQGGTPYTLTPGQSGVVTVRFAPLNSGSFSNAVVFISNGGNTNISVTGIALTPAKLAALPANLDFGTVAVGASSQQSLVLTNQGGAAITSGSASIAGTSFAILSGTPFSLPGFGSTNLVVRFTPSAEGNFNDVVTMTTLNDDGSTNLLTGVGAVIPLANFIGSPTSGLKPLTVTFTDLSTGTITNRFWDFGDGSTSNTSATSLTHLYSVASTNSVSLTVTGPVGTNTFTQNNYLIVTNLPPQLVLGATNIDFGTVIMGQTRTQLVEVINNGGLTLSGTVTVPLPFNVETGSPFNIGPGQTGQVAISFSPVVAGSYSNAIVFLSNGGDRSGSVTGIAVTAPQVSISPPTVDFGIIEVGITSDRTLVLTNQGGAYVSNGLATISSGPFTIVSGTPFTLPGFGSTNLVVRFAPVNAGAFSNAVVITSGNGGGGVSSVIGNGAFVPLANFSANPNSGLKPLMVTFTDLSSGTISGRFWDFGDGSTSNTTATTVSHLYPGAGTNTVSLTVSGPLGTNTLIQGNFVLVTNLPAQLVLDSTNVDFGTIPAGQTSTRTIRVMNNGGLTLAGTIGATLPFSVQSGSPFSVLPGESALVTISFNPVASGVYSNAVVFLSNGGDSFSSVTGTALIPAQLSVSPTSINFATVVVGATTQANFTLSNLGEAPLSNGVATLNAGAFTIVSGSPFNLPGFSSTNLVVRFAPASAGNFSNAVIITSANDGSSTNSVTGTAAIVPSTDFVGNPTSGLKPLLVTLTDTSAGTVTNRFWTFGDGSTSNTSAGTVSHLYANAGNFTVALTASGPVGNNTLIKGGYIVVTNPPPQLTLNPTNIDFGPLPVGQSATQIVSIVNNGGLTLSGTVSATLPFAIQSGSPYTLDPGQTGTVSVTFSPASGGAFSNAAVFLSNGGNRISSLIGTGLTPAQLQVSPATLDFGTVSAGATVQANFILTNLGNLPITSGTATVAGGPFALVSGNSFTIPGLSATNVRVRFSPIKAGNFSNVVVFATENDGGSTNAVIGISTFAPVADFGATSTNGAKPLTVNFNDRSTGSITNWFWDFGDGFTSNTFGGNVSHTYTVAGKYSISLNVIGPLGSDTRTNTNFVTVVDGLLITSIRQTGPDVQIKFYSQAGLFYRVEYTDTLSPPDWKSAIDFISGTGDIVTAIHANAAGRLSRFYRVAQLNNADLLPAANFTASPLFGLTPLTVTFVDISAGFVTNRFWDFGDGSTTNTTATTVSHTYTSAGSKTVTLTASGPFGDSAFTRPNYIFTTDQLIITSIRTSGSDVVLRFTSRQGEFYRVEYTDTFTPAVWKIAVAAVPGTGDIVAAIHTGGAGQRSRFYRIALLGSAELAPVADFVATPNLGQSPLKVTFTDTSTGYATNRFWDFGDGSNTNTTATTVSHTYVSAGTNTVRLVVSGPFGISVRSRPKYIVAIDYLLITSIRISGPDAMISFTSSAGEFYRLEYTDGLTSPVWKPAGDFILGTGDIVTAIHQGGFSQSARFYRVHLGSLIELVPSANFDANVTFGPPPLPVNFVDESAGYVTNRFWSFGDGSTTNTTLPTVFHTYGSVGSNTVVLTVTGPFGVSTITRTNFINVVRQIIISGIRMSGSDVILNFSSETGQSYRVEYTDNLLLPWNIAVDSVPGTGAVMAVTHVSGGGAAARFYRIRQL